MQDQKRVKTLSFRADPETLELLQELKADMSAAYGLPVSNSDIFRKALKELENDWKWGTHSLDLIQEKGWKE